MGNGPSFSQLSAPCTPLDPKNRERLSLFMGCIDIYWVNHYVDCQPFVRVPFDGGRRGQYREWNPVVARRTEWLVSGSPGRICVGIGDTDPIIKGGMIAGSPRCGIASWIS